MSVDPTPDPAKAATGADTDAAAANAADDVNKHTPETPAAPPEGTKEPTNSEPGLAELRDTVGNLANAVSALTDLVTKSVSKDESATAKVPWLLR